MRNRLITALLILLSFAGIAVSVLFLRREQEEALERQQKVSKLAADLQPINEKRKEWQNKDKEWQAKLAEKKQGKSCILLSFDNMSSEMYETIYDMVDQYGFRATFALRNGMVPSWKEGLLNKEEMQEMLRSGWEYALSIGDEPVPTRKDKKGHSVYEEEESESESETEEDSPSFLEQVDSALASISKAKEELPVTLFCTKEQFEEASGTAIAAKGFSMVQVLDSDAFPVIAEKGESLWRIDCGLYNQKDTDFEEALDQAIQNKESMAISINEVLKISRNADYDLSLVKFSSLLNYLKGMEEQGQVNILTYSEFYQYEEQLAEEYEALVKEYVAFRREMNDDIASLDAQEQQVVEEARSTEVADTQISDETESAANPGQQTSDERARAVKSGRRTPEETESAAKSGQRTADETESTAKSGQQASDETESTEMQERMP